MSRPTLNTPFESQLSRRYCQTFSVGFSSSDLGGNGSRLMLAGIVRFGDMCQPG